jgi:tetratricopeptide (TPR) repeat protein
MPTTDRRPARRPGAPLAALLLVGLLLVGLLFLGQVAPAGADESRVDDLLHRARHLELVEGNAEDAIRLYEQVLEFEDVPPEKRGRALRALARIHLAAGRLDQAQTWWQRIRDDKELSNKLRDWAKSQQDDHRKADGEGASQAEQDRQLRERLRAEVRRRVTTALNASRSALDAGRFEEARRRALAALALDRENKEANEILARIEARSPDRDDMWRQLLALVESQDLVEYDRVREEVQQRNAAARRAFDNEDWREADRLYREAIRRIDDSGFLGFGGTVDPHSLDELRAGLLVWLRQTHERGRKASRTSPRGRAACARVPSRSSPT